MYYSLENMAKKDEDELNKIVTYLGAGDFQKIREILKKLKEKDTKIDLSSFTCNSTKISKLHLAVVLGDIQVAKDLIFKGAAHVDAQTKQKCRPLHLALIFDQSDMIRMLLKTGADPHLDRYFHCYNIRINI